MLALRMRIMMTGGTGFLGRPLCHALLDDGHDVGVVSRRPDQAQEDLIRSQRGSLSFLKWTANESPREWARLVDGWDAIVNLAGESIAEHRWTDDVKQRLYDSRILLTRGLVRGILAASRPPRLLVNGSAVGYYGSRGADILAESSSPGSDFLAQLCVDWEKAALEAKTAVTKVALLRTGVVIAASGGALAKMLTPFKLGVGGQIGNGQQYMSWIHRRDWIALAKGVITYELEGAFNLTAPTPVTNSEFVRELGKALGRPAALPMPAFALKLALGEMGEALLLSSQRAIPQRALDQGYQFDFPSLAQALPAALKD
jgi:uncharacterized protein (TIGR01777 family)